jgi:hypothetical protein
MQDYKMVLRGIVTGATIKDQSTGAIVAQNASEFMSYLNEAYLSQGYVVTSVQNVRVIPADANGTPLIYEFAYHLVKEVTPKTAK